VQVQLLTPDVAGPQGPAPGGASGDGSAFSRLVDAAGAVLGDAGRAEAAFVAHRGGLQEMVVERARADIALQIAAAAAQRTVQAVGTILGMQL
jgi:flagellar hook-basal body complex protein FliE